MIAQLPDERIVLVRRPGGDHWTLPGGLVEWGERVADAAGRELAEETSLEMVEIRRLVGVYSSLPGRQPHGVYVTVAAAVRGEPRAAQPAEVEEVRCWPADELPLGQMLHVHAQPLRDWLVGGATVE